MALTAKKVYAILKRQISDMEAKIKTPIIYRGTVATADLLPLNPDIGDMYNIESKSVYGEAGMNVAWNGVVWDTMGAPINMSLYIKSSELADWVKQQNKPTYTAEEVGALPADTKIPSKTSDLQNDSGFLTKIPDNYLSGTDKTLSVSGKAADAKATGDKITELSADISNKLNKNQGSENSGKITGINESGDIVPMFPVSVDYNEETNCLEFGSDQKMELNKGINLDNTLTKTGYAADAGAVGKITDSLKEDLSNKITKFYASSQGKTYLADSDNGKIQDMMLYGKSEQKQYSGKNLFDANDTGGPFPLSADSDGWYIVEMSNAGSDIVYKNITTKPSNKLKPSTQYTIITEIEKLENAIMCISSTPNTETFKGQINEYIEITKTGVTKVTATTIDDFSKSDTLLRTFVRIDPGKTVKVKFRVNVVEGDATENPNWEYEPYTGGIPSPNPDYPQEIKSVANPTVKVYGKNLLKATLQTTIKNGVTCTANGDGTYTLNGIAATITTFDIAQDVSCSSFRLAGCPVGGDHDVSYELQARTNNLIYGYDTGDGKNIKADENFFIRIRINTGINCNNLLFKPMIVDASLYPDATYNDFEPYHEQTVTLPYTLNAIPVSAGGNVTIDGQQYIADYVDVERGKLVKMVEKKVLNGTEDWKLNERSGNRNGVFYIYVNANIADALCDKAIYESLTSHYGTFDTWYGQIRFYAHTNEMTLEEWCNFLSSNNHVVYIIRNTPEETDLTEEELQSFKLLQAYYPTTNISINSEQLDGYTVFNYPISMANGWNYVKKQLNDNRDYIYDMDIQSAEAYVNSEYAVALTELEA